MFASLMAFLRDVFKVKTDPLFRMKGMSFKDASAYRLANYASNCGLCWMDMLVFKNDNAPPEVLERLEDWKVSKKKWVTVDEINFLVSYKWAWPATDISFDVEVVAEGVIHLVIRDDLSGYKPRELMKLHGKVMIGSSIPVFVREDEVMVESKKTFREQLEIANYSFGMTEILCRYSSDDSETISCSSAAGHGNSLELTPQEKERFDHIKMYNSEVTDFFNAYRRKKGWTKISQFRESKNVRKNFLDFLKKNRDMRLRRLDMEVCSRLFHDYCYTAAVSDHFDFVRDLKDGKTGGTLIQMLKRYADKYAVDLNDITDGTDCGNTTIYLSDEHASRFPFDGADECNMSEMVKQMKEAIYLVRTNGAGYDEVKKEASRVRSEYKECRRIKRHNKERQKENEIIAMRNREKKRQRRIEKDNRRSGRSYMEIEEDEELLVMEVVPVIWDDDGFALSWEQAGEIKSRYRVLVAAKDFHTKGSYA
ncbi:hypothetical protein BDZ89DRAFT_1070973 [Hymenopellis radicata]|nr:hypothetical protein BDZ89DRAFT_1070973 [Hymenopellis radicata]